MYGYGIGEPKGIIFGVYLNHTESLGHQMNGVRCKGETKWELVPDRGVFCPAQVFLLGSRQFTGYPFDCRFLFPGSADADIRYFWKCQGFLLP